jgi:hypothetical protein
MNKKNNAKETSWFIRLPFTNNAGFFHNSYILTESNIESLKRKADAEGRSLGKFIAYHLKKIANDTK